jgi:hypothetical protein
MNEVQPTQSLPAIPSSAEWLNGYAAALHDAITIVEAMGGPSFNNLSTPVLLRLKTRLIELQGGVRAA